MASTKSFIQTNRQALAKDISRGGGETIKNLATLSGCTDAGAVGTSLQKNFSTIFPAADVVSAQGSAIDLVSWESLWPKSAGPLARESHRSRG